MWVFSYVLGYSVGCVLSLCQLVTWDEVCEPRDLWETSACYGGRGVCRLVRAPRRTSTAWSSDLLVEWATQCQKWQNEKLSGKWSWQRPGTPSGEGCPQEWQRWFWVCGHLEPPTGCDFRPKEGVQDIRKAPARTRLVCESLNLPSTRQVSIGQLWEGFWLSLLLWTDAFTNPTDRKAFKEWRHEVKWHSTD